MERQIQLEGCDNFRDLGGYPVEGGGEVRWRTLYRSDALTRLTVDDVGRMRGELQVTDIVDLRSDQELANDGRGRLGEASIRFHHVPLIGSHTPPAALPLPNAEFTLGDRYFFLMEAASGEIRRVIEIFAESESAAVFNCAAGKDRTGVISAVVLGVLGVREEIIVADYAATRENLDEIIERLMSNEGYKGMLEHLPEDTLHAEPETMTQLLDHVREKWGSMRGYAEHIGVPPPTLSRLETKLVSQ